MCKLPPSVLSLHSALWWRIVIIEVEYNDAKNKNNAIGETYVFINSDKHCCQIEKYESYTFQVDSKSYLVQTLDGVWKMFEENSFLKRRNEKTKKKKCWNNEGHLNL